MRGLMNLLKATDKTPMITSNLLKKSLQCLTLQYKITKYFPWCSVCTNIVIVWLNSTKTWPCKFSHVTTHIIFNIYQLLLRYHLYITSGAAHLLLLHASEDGGRTSRMLRILPLPRYRTKLSRLLYLYIGCYFMCHQYFSGQQYQTIYGIFVCNVKEK